MKVLQILQDNKITFIEKGGDYLVHCLNPEHKDTHPSLRIDKLTGKYNCFSCGFKGNIYRLYGLSEPIISNMLQDTLKLVNEMLVDTRGLELPDSAEDFNMDFRGIKASTFKHFKAFTHSDYDGRLCVPIENHLTGKITNIIARSLFSNVSPRYLIYPFGGNVPLFPFIKSNTIILVEGIFDLLNLYDKGLTNAVCTFGTKTIEHDLKEKLLPYFLNGTNKIVILFDPDDAGMSAETELANKLSKEGYLVYKATSLLKEFNSDPGALNQSQVDVLKHQITCLIE